ncbi:GNAT family N-acetyltransferase [Streptosporangium sp. NPDC023825]|uniref:GNAT family N-acetyltransferase n=1 Tax=Streptosporangium sp. NPDC023825 TaxID=3154909 RepID=UPI0034423879
MTWRSQPLHEEHDPSAFDCSVPVMNEWLARMALRAQRSDTARTYVWSVPGSHHVVGYFSVTPTEVRRAEVGGSLSGGVSIVPGYLLARLALDRHLHGQGLGAELLVNAVSKIVSASETAGGRVIVVDAIDGRAADFYASHGFTPVKNDPHRLVMKMATARASLAAS